MKIFSFLIVILLLGFSACGSDERGNNNFIPPSIENEIQDTIVSVSCRSYDDKYFVTMENGKVKMFPIINVTGDNVSYKKSEQMWVADVENVETEFDSGFGETEIVQYMPCCIVFYPNSYNSYVFYKANNSGWFYFYDMEGNLLNKVLVYKGNTMISDKCPWNKSLYVMDVYLMSDRYPDKEYVSYQTFDECGNSEIYKYLENGNKATAGLHLGTFVEIEKTNKGTFYVNYSVNNIEFVLVDEVNKIVSKEGECDLYSFIKERYSEEETMPRYEIVEVEPNKETSIAIVYVTLYDGTKECLEVLLDNQSGVIIG